MKSESDSFPYATLEQMYDAGLDEKIFPGGWGNYGDWEMLQFEEGEIPLDMRLKSQENLYHRLLSKLFMTPDDWVLEIGSGQGKGAELIQSEYEPAKLVALDANHKQSQRTKTTLDKPDTAAKVVQALAEELPFRDGIFDHIISVEAIQHFKNPRDFIKEAYRILKPNGRLVFSSFFAHDKKQSRSLTKDFPTVRLGIDNFIPVKDLLKWLTTAGFENINMEARGKWVWTPLIKWCHQVRPEQKWSDNFLTAYREGNLDYYHFFAQKPGNQLFPLPI